MTAEAKRRVALYGATAALLGALAYFGFVYEVPPDAGTRLAGAAMVGNVGLYDEAIEICRKTIEEHPESLDAHVYLASMQARKGDHKAALEAYDRSLELATDAVVRKDLMVDRASVLLALGRDADFRATRRCCGQPLSPPLPPP